jgi:hypothetical protein
MNHSSAENPLQTTIESTEPGELPTFPLIQLIELRSAEFPTLNHIKDKMSEAVDGLQSACQQVYGRELSGGLSARIQREHQYGWWLGGKWFGHDLIAKSLATEWDIERPSADNNYKKAPAYGRLSTDVLYLTYDYGDMLKRRAEARCKEMSDSPQIAAGFSQVIIGEFQDEVNERVEHIDELLNSPIIKWLAGAAKERTFRTEKGKRRAIQDELMRLFGFIGDTAFNPKGYVRDAKTLKNPSIREYLDKIDADVAAQIVSELSSAATQEAVLEYARAKLGDKYASLSDEDRRTRPEAEESKREYNDYQERPKQKPLRKPPPNIENIELDPSDPKSVAYFAINELRTAGKTPNQILHEIAKRYRLGRIGNDDFSEEVLQFAGEWLDAAIRYANQ